MVLTRKAKDWLALIGLVLLILFTLRFCVHPVVDKQKAGDIRDNRGRPTSQY